MKPSTKRPSEPWHGFLRAMDEALTAPTRMDCIGGFVVTQVYGLDRPTIDLDVIELAPAQGAETLLMLGQRGGPLSRKHHVYLDKVAVAAMPEEYEGRLVEMFPGAYRQLRLMAVGPYDLALSKLERNSQKDRDDVRYLARTVPLDLERLRHIYAAELRPILGVPQREDLTLQLWLEMIEEDRS